MPIPPKPAVFVADRAPSWCELKLDAYKTAAGETWWKTRTIIRPKLQLVHTNAARREGSIEAAINWGNAASYSNTHPHYQVDRNRAAKLVPTDRKGIGNKTTVEARGDHGDVADWSIVIETADEGYPTPGEAGGFIGNQVEMIAQILAYESILHGIPLRYPTQWWEAGTACHTEPFGYPYWTNANGKVCPGRTKKQQMRQVVLPRAIEIAAAWSGPPEPEEPVARILWRPKGFKNVFVIEAANAIQATESTLKAWGYDLDNLPVTVEDHPQMLKAVLAKSGLALSDLVKET